MITSATQTPTQQKHLPEFASFLADHCLDEFVKEVLRLSRETNIPILKYFTSFSEEELIELSKKNYIDLFGALKNNNLQVYAEASLKRWSSNMLPQIERDQIVLEDITLSGHIRKNAFLKFIPRYTADITQVIELVKEIDEVVQILATGSFSMFITLLENRVQQHLEHFKQAQAITHIGDYVWDLSNRNLVWSDELYRIYGLNPETEKISDSAFIATFNHPDDVSIVNVNIQQAIQTLKPFDFYYRIILRDKSIKTLHARGEIIANSDGTALRILGTAQDVTERQNLILQLQKSEGLYKQSQAMAHLGNWDWEIGKDKVNWSDELYRIYGLEPQSIDINFEVFLSRIHPDDREMLTQHTKKSLETKEPNEFYHRIILPNGDVKILHAKSEVLKDISGNAVQLFGATQDVTEQVKAEQVLQQRTQQLQQSNASLEEFAFVASHDLKEPLRKISAFSDRFLYSYRNSIPEEGRQYLEKIMTSSNRMQAMVDDLLSLSMISSDRKTERVSLQRLMEEALIMLEHKIETTKAKIEIDSLPEWNVVPSQFRQLFQNLVANSLKFLRKDSTPVISIHYRILNSNEVVTYGVKKSNSYLELIFSDNGIGFDNEYSEKIFSVFQRLHHKEAFEGTGIGLAICKKIVENHAGFIKAEGVLNQGAVFKIIIPDETIQ